MIRSKLSKAATYLDKGMYPVMILFKYACGYIVLTYYLDGLPQPGVFEAVHEYPEATVAILAFGIFLIAGDAARYHHQEHWINDTE